MMRREESSERSRQGIVVRVLKIILLLELLFVTAAGLFLVALNVYYWSDAVSMSDLIGQYVPLRSNVDHVSAFIGSGQVRGAPVVRRFEQDHGLLPPLNNDSSPPVTNFSHYQADYLGWQAYPTGEALQMTLDSAPFGKLMQINFFFDNRGRLIRYNVGEHGDGPI